MVKDRRIQTTTLILRSQANLRTFNAQTTFVKSRVALASVSRLYVLADLLDCGHAATEYFSTL